MARVLVVTTSFPARAGDPSGHFVETEARLRARGGDDVTVLAPGPGRGEHPARPRDDGLSVKWLPGGDAFGWPGALSRVGARPWRALAAARFVVAAEHAVRRLGAFDELVAHWVVPSAWPIARRGRGALEVVVHGSDVKVVERLPRACRVALAGDLLARGACFRFVADELRTRFVRATLDAVDARSRVEACAIDVSGVPSRADARARLGIGNELLSVVVGRLVPSKEPLRAVRVAAAESERVVVIGDGPLLDELRRAAPGARFLGRLSRPDALAWIAAADFLVSASREEGASTVVREARALGTRVLAARAGDIAARALADPGITLLSDDAIRESAA